MIYLDNNATTQIDPRVTDAMAEAYGRGYVNPSSAHQMGQRARRRLEAAREHVLELLGGSHSAAGGDAPDQTRLIWTSGGTESNNLALRGLAGPPPNRILVSSLEHPSVREVAAQLHDEGYDVQIVRATAEGRVDLEHLEQLLETPTRLVSVMWVNHETGVIQPIGEVGRLCRAAGALLHTDAVQAVGKLPVAFAPPSTSVDALSFTAHKFHGPRGIGGLLLRGGVTLEPMMRGGFQQMTLRPGTESVELAIGLETALALWHQEAEARAARMQKLRRRFERLLLEQVKPTPRVQGSAGERAPHTSNIAFPGQDRQALLLALDMAGLACSTGSACESGSSEPSPVLQAMGLPESVVESSLRFSFSAQTTDQEIDEAVSTICRVVEQA